MIIQCNKCKEILECNFPWAFKQCKCDNWVFIDEVDWYVRLGWTKQQYTILDKKMKFSTNITKNAS